MRWFPLLSAPLACLVWLLSCSACLAAESPERIVLVGDKSYAPFEYLDDSGQAQGLFVDYWRIWAKETGVELEYRLLPWQDALQAVEEGQAEAVAAIFYSHARDKRFDFTPSYFTIATHIFVHENSKELHTEGDLQGQRVGVVAGDLAEEVLPQKIPGLDLHAWPTHDALIRAALDGEVDIFVADTQVAAYHLRQQGGLAHFRPLDEPIYVSKVHAAVRQGDAATLALLEKGMDLVPHEQLELLVAEHFHSDPETRDGFPWLLVGAAGAGVALLVLLVLLWNRLLRLQVKQAVLAMEQSERRFKAIFDHSYQFMALLDAQGHIQRLNQAVLQRMPYQENCQGLPFWSMPGWRENPQSHEALRQAITDAAQGQVARLEQEVMDGNGFLYLDITIKPLFNDDGQVELLIAEARDLSARKQVERELQAMRDTLQERVEERTRELSEANEALQQKSEERQKVEAALRSSEEKYRLLVENAGEGIVVLQGKTLEYCNPKIEEISGYKQEELLGRPFIELVHPEDRGMAASNYQARLSGQQAPEKYDFRIIDRFGHVRWLEIVAVRFTWEGAPATLNLLNDISQRKEAEQAMLKAKRMAEDASRIMSDFVSMVSHELRTPMTSVLGFAKLIQKDFQRWFANAAAKDTKLAKRATRVEENLQIIIDESERLTQLINDVLDLAKFESDKYEWQFEDTSLEAVAEQAINATSPLFMDTEVTALSRVEPDLPPVLCDRKSLVQVLVNLLANAAKFTQQGEVCIAASKQNHEALVSVCDTGCGIPEEEQNRIFERFQQVGELLTDKPGGTGLGLSICKEIISHHGGHIWVESTPGEGSCFYFTLPLVEEDVVDEALNRG